MGKRGKRCHALGERGERGARKRCHALGKEGKEGKEVRKRCCERGAMRLAAGKEVRKRCHALSSRKEGKRGKGKEGKEVPCA